MTKPRNNLGLAMLGGGVFCMLLASPLAGCKKQEPPPPPPKAMPLPQKPVQKNVSAAKQVPAPGTQPGQQGAATAGQPAAAQAAAKPAVQKQVSTAKTAVPAGAVSLDFTNKRDPFRPFVQAPQPQKTAAIKSSSRVKDPLPIQSFDTEKFRVSGIITGVRENSALVLDPNGKGYVVKEGMLLGNNDGRVKRITTSAVEVEESFRDDGGKLKKRLVKLTLIRKK